MHPFIDKNPVKVQNSVNKGVVPVYFYPYGVPTENIDKYFHNLHCW